MWGPSLAFWIFLGAVVLVPMWLDARKKADKHETLRRILEKTGTIDEAKWRELFKEEPSREPKPGSGYRALRIAGTIIMFIAAGVAMFFVMPTLFGSPIEWWFGGLGISAGIAMLGLGVFISSGFAEPPPGSRNEPPAR